MEKRELSEKELREKKEKKKYPSVAYEGDKVPAGFHVLCGNPGDDKSAA